MAEMRLVEDTSWSYAPRTWHNAKSADLTIAVALDYTTHGEALTKKAAGDRFLALPFNTPVEENARVLTDYVHERQVKVLNVAGNGIHTFTKAGVWEQTVFLYIYLLLRTAHAEVPFSKIISGGQTGADIAGIIAARKLGIDFEATFPKGYRQRNANGQDSAHTFEEIVQQIENAVRILP